VSTVERVPQVATTRALRVAILDDAPYVSWHGRHHAVNATFHRFAGALLDVRDADGRPAVGQVVLAAPVREADREPGTLPVDPRIRVMPTLPFDGIAGYLRRAPVLATRNLPRLRRAFADADVILLRLPASNGLPAAALAVAMGRPRVAYVVGSVAGVAAGQDRPGAARVAARVVGLAYDAATRLAGAGAERVVVGRFDRDGGIVSSLVLPDEIRTPPAAHPDHPERTLQLVYAGRLVDGKGVEDLLASVARLVSGSRAGAADVELDILGDGPARPALEQEAARLGIAGQVSFAGHIADRAPYLDRLARADLFVTASPAEGFPKTVLDAMAVGLPVAAVPAGSLTGLAHPGATPQGAAIASIPAGDPAAIAGVIGRLHADAHEMARLRAAGHSLVRSHTMPAEAERLVAVLQRAAGRRAR
jgi:hypothetical protein